MIRLLADENFDNRILRGVQRENANADIVRVQDTDLYEADDSTVLAWAASESRIVLSHDSIPCQNTPMSELTPMNRCRV